MHLVIPPGEVKNKNPLEFELPPDVVRILELYLQKFRPLLVTRWLQLPVPGATGRSQDSRAIGRTNQARHKEGHRLDRKRPPFPACLCLSVPQSPSGRLRDRAAAARPLDPGHDGAGLLRIGAVGRSTTLRSVSSTSIDDRKGMSRMSVERRCLPIASWPERDRLAWEAGTRPADLFEERNAGADWSPRSRQKTARGYGRWLCWPMEKRSVRSDTRAWRPGDETARRRLCRNAFRELRSIHCRLPPAGALRRLARPGAGGRIGGGSPNFGCDLVVGRACCQQTASPTSRT